MTSDPQPGAGDDDVVTDAGSSTDQHVTGAPETGTFLTDQAPSADTQAHGSSNAGVNNTHAGDPQGDPTAPAS